MTLTIKIILGALLTTLIGLISFQFIDPKLNTEPLTTTVDNKNMISVQIEGEVKQKGTFIIEKGSTLDDLIYVAGGLTSNADVLCFNEDYEIENKQSYYIAPLYDKDDICTTDKLVKYNINNCKKEDLEQIEGIGSTIAQSVIQYRDEVTSYRALEEIMNVNGIGNATFSKIKNRIRLRDN